MNATMRRRHFTGSYQQSFLDLLFGALGSVVLLFILMIIASGSSSPSLTPIPRVITWKIESERLPATRVALYRLDNKEFPSNEGALLYADSPSDFKVFTGESPSEPETTPNGVLSWKRSYENNKVVLEFKLEVEEDKYWTPALALEIQFDQKPQEDITVTVEASPGQKAAREKVLPVVNLDDLKKYLRIETVVNLEDAADEEGGGKLPLIEAADFIFTGEPIQ